MKDITISPDASIKNAMVALDRTAEKILLVVDEEKTLIGCLTDGDIRRCILKGLGLNNSIGKAYNPNPVYILQKEFNSEKIKAIFLENKMEVIPILDNARKVVDYITWEKAFGNKRELSFQKLDAAVVIMAGGRGTRLEPFTRVLPKPLIPVGDKPLIDHIIDKFRTYGAKEFYLTIHHMSKILRAYFDEKGTDYSVDFVEEDEPRGTAGSLKLLTNKLNRPFFVSNCDIIVEADYTDIFQFHIRKNHDITLVASAKQYNIPYGVCELNSNGSLDRIQEKPEYNFFINTGLYVLSPHVLEAIPERGMFHITQLMDKIKEKGGTIGVYPVSESSWVDVGQWEEYRKALKAIEGI